MPLFAIPLMAVVSNAQDSGALLDLLVKKKVISDQEAEDVRADLVKEYANTSAGKVNLAPSITEMKLSGDLRMRYQYDNRDYEVPPTVTSQPGGSTVYPAWQSNQTPIWVSDKGGSWYRDNNGNFHELKKGQTRPANLKDTKSYARLNGAHYYGAYSNQEKGNHGGQQNRWRFRLRIRDEFKLTNNWFGGVELTTGVPSDSGNQTFGESGAVTAGKSAPGSTASGFGHYGIYISKAFMGWNATDWATVTIGKQANPFYTTDLVWDPDINPDGIVENVRFHKMFFGGGDTASGLSKDGKSTVGPAIREERPWELTLNMGQFIFSDNIENGLVITEPGIADNDPTYDAYLFEFQLQGSYKFSSNVKATFAPAFMFYNAARVSGANNETPFTDVAPVTLPNGSASYVGETRDLAILTAPGDVTIKLRALPVKFYWDFAYNTEGSKRADDIYQITYYTSDGQLRYAHQTLDDIAWLAGLQLGENKKAGDWSLNANFRQTGIASVDPNLNDSDFALGRLNTQGFKVSAMYNFTDFATGALTYYNAWQLRDNLIGGQAAKLSDLNNIQILQADLSIKF